MNIVLLILIIFYVIIYIEKKGTPNKPLKEIWNEYKQEMQKINEEHR